MGLGAIGRGIARCALQKSELEIVAAIDLDPGRVGRKLSDVVDAPSPEVIIGSDASAEMRKAQGGVLLHATGSRLDRVEGELAQALTAGLSVVSTCEELSYPWLRHPEIAERLDKLAQKRKLGLLGTGIKQVARAFHDGKEVANLDLTIALGAPQPRDEIELEGDPGIRVLIPGGTPGDKATIWTVVHAAPLVVGSEPGLISVLDLPAGR